MNNNFKIIHATFECDFNNFFKNYIESKKVIDFPPKDVIIYDEFVEITEDIFLYVVSQSR